jgi:ParB family protein of integrating conjugative element (PFGI_1 class)
MTAPKNPAPTGLPLTVSLAEVVKNMGLKDKPEPAAAKRAMVSTASLRPAEAAPFGRPGATDGAGGAGTPSGPVSTKAEREAAQRHASYMVGDSTPSKVDLSRKDIAGPMLLEVTQIDSYDGNPRQFENEATEDIRTSLAANGYTDAMVVTRRREGDRFMLAAGSNTTLKVLKELWESTGDEKYRYVNCIFQPFESEARVLAQHLGENLNRGGMKFWEIATGMTDLLALIGRERGKPMSVREQVAELNKRGLRAGPSDVAYWSFAVSRLAALGPAVRHLAVRYIKDHFQPRLNALQRLALKFKVDESAYWSTVVDPCLQRAAKASSDASTEEAAVDADALCREVEARLAEHLGEPIASVQRMLAVLKLSPELTLADLRLPMGSPVSGTAPSREPGDAADAHPARSAQAPLPLPPGVVRVTGSGAPHGQSLAAPDATPPAASPSLVPASESANAATAVASARLPSTQGPLFSGSASADPLGTLLSAVQELLSLARLSDTLRPCDEMPLGFFVELPDRQLHASQAAGAGNAALDAHAIKTHVWWTLVLMTGQYREGSVPYMDRASGFYRFAASDTEGPSPLQGTDIEETAPDIEDLLMFRMSGGAARPVMRQLARVEELAAELFAAAPERWRRMLEVNRQRT